MGEPLSKRARRGEEKKEDTALDGNEKQELISTLWGHWQAYLASTEQEDPEASPDVDELIEMLEIANQHKDRVPGISLPPAGVDDDAGVVAHYVKTFQEPFDLIPVLLSVAAHVLADDAIALYLEQKSSGEDNEEDDGRLAPRKYLKEALTWFPANASTWSMLANWIRMTQVQERSLEIANIYRYAANQCSILRRAGLEVLAQCPENEVEVENEEECAALPPLQGMIESLLLNQVVDVEYDGPEEEDNDDEDEKNANTETKEHEETEQWSVSAVEGTARFMAAMQLSMAGYHDEAAVQLRHFDCTHRLHPNVWNKEMAVKKDGDLASIVEEPALFTTPVLPKHIHEQLQRFFEPKASYWVESSYSQRGYYSFFVDRLKNEKQPKDFVQDLIESYLLPLVDKRLPQGSDPIVGYEWWVHTRPLAANLGHNLHFDTDESLLKSQKKVTHPVVSSVLYLDGTAGQAGPTIVLNQSSDESAANADIVWRNDPTPNSFLLFPGRLLHGVLPCSSSPPTKVDNVKSASLDPSWAPDLKDYLSEDLMPKTVDKEPHRLSFMVGFWTRRVRDDIIDPDRLYGPCSQIPPPTQAHSWVKQIQHGYPRKGFQKVSEGLEPSKIPQVSPAWECLSSNNKPTRLLEIPKALDHRYFVRDPPACFRDSLFERDEDDCEGGKED
eukprot:scaffold32086_cov183-Amphora_coffeaeformis.AAC.26